jgi:PIN domain nuclease of toxin-antitoxin system
MRTLVDTHMLLWWLGNDPRLPASASAAIRDPDNDVLVSAASAWEIAIKKALGRLEAPDDLVEVVEANGFTALPIMLGHALRAGSLPPHHADPFDRMLIAQAQAERLTVITADRRFARYDVELLPIA